MENAPRKYNRWKYIWGSSSGVSLILSGGFYKNTKASIYFLAISILLALYSIAGYLEDIDEEVRSGKRS